MTYIRCHTLGRRVSLALIGMLVAGMIAPPGMLIGPRPEAQQGVETVLAFPAVDESEDGNLEEVASRLTSALALAGREIAEVDLEVFSETSPMVRRGIADGALRTADVEGPKDARAALVIGQAFRVDSVVLLAVQGMTASGDPRSVEINVMGTKYEVAPNVDPETGQVVGEPQGNTFGVSGVTKARDRQRADDRALIRLAARNAAYKILHVLAGTSAEAYVEEGAKPRKRSDLWKWVAIALVGLGLIAVTAGGDGDDDGPPADELIPTRLSARATRDGIRLSWVPPSTVAKTIFAYQIQRSAAGSNFVRIDGDNVGPSATAFTDFEISAGTAYVYQIRVLYTDGFTSRWATFVQVVAP
jgi:hypothetical protein